MSDALGRRRPLLAGLFVFQLASIGCAFAPSIVPLLALRLIQGLAGGAGIAIARAVVRDRASGPAAAHAYGVLMVIGGFGPILAPILGAGLLRITDWRGIFVALAAIGAVLATAVGTSVPETLDVAARRNKTGSTASAFGTLLHDRDFTVPALACSLAGCSVFAYIAGSPFVLEHTHHLSAQEFSIVFASIGLTGLLVRYFAAEKTKRHGARAVLGRSIAFQSAGAAGVLVFTLFDAGLAPLLFCLAISVGSMGAILPAGITLVMEDHPELAGTASGMLGFGQSILAAAVAPLVGIGGASATAPMGLAMVGSSWSALAIIVLARRGVRCVT